MTISQKPSSKTPPQLLKHIHEQFHEYPQDVIQDALSILNPIHGLIPSTRQHEHIPRHLYRATPINIWNKNILSFHQKGALETIIVVTPYHLWVTEYCNYALVTHAPNTIPNIHKWLSNEELHPKWSNLFWDTRWITHVQIT